MNLISREFLKEYRIILLKKIKSKGIFHIHLEFSQIMHENFDELCILFNKIYLFDIVIKNNNYSLPKNDLTDN
jgi:hypothetical protein